MGIISGKKIIIFNYLLFIPEDVKNILFDEKIIDFHFYEKKNFSLIVLTKNDIKYVCNDEKKIPFYKINKKFSWNFYSQKRKILIIFFRDEIQIFKLNFPNIETIFTYNLKNSGIYHSLNLFDEKQLEDDELCKFYFSDYFGINSFSITCKKPIIDERDIKGQEEKLEDFLKNIIKKISDIPLLLSKKNNIENVYEKTKKYFDFDAIQQELKTIKKRNLFKRKEEVKNNLKQISLKVDIQEKYLFILILLVNDNTNQKLINEYLVFLKDNKNKLEEIYKEDFENYENELSFYLNIIKVEDAFKILKETKKSQKDELITFMDDLLKYKEKTTNEFENYLNSFEEFYKKAKYYNMPADRENEELCYYGYLHLIKYSLNNLSKLIKEKKMKIETDDSIDKDMKIKKRKKL